MQLLLCKTGTKVTFVFGSGFCLAYTRSANHEYSSHTQAVSASAAHNERGRGGFQTNPQRILIDIPISSSIIMPSINPA
jgi:hypothetical protein